jgi:two-component system response regulator GlrR
MTYKWVVIEDAPCTVEPQLVQALDGSRPIRLAWDQFREQAPGRASDAVVAVAHDAAGVAKLVDWLRASQRERRVLAVLPEEAPPELLRSAAAIADDFVLWPARQAELRHRLTRAMAPRHSPEAVESRLVDKMGLDRLVGEDPAFLAIVERLALAARSESPALLTGETGTGKEVCARAIHHLSSRRDRPFIAVDCGAIPDHLFENELFGHARGAFTDARNEQKGLVSLAEGGTFFLDEVDALSSAAQAKLLRFLEERTFKPLGSERFLRADVRVIAATSRDLASAISERLFRSDLFFRLDVLRFHLIPLRERPGDIPILAGHFLDSLCRSGPDKGLSAAAVRKLALHSWPGNIRELANVIQRAYVFASGPEILPTDITLPDLEPRLSEEAMSFREARARALEDFERHYLVEVLRRHSGNVTRAARDAGKDRRVFGRLVKKYGIDRLRL